MQRILEFTALEDSTSFTNIIKNNNNICYKYAVIKSRFISQNALAQS